MTTLREAAQQALEALESAVEYDYHGTPLTETHAGFNDAANALRIALAEPENWELLRLSEELERCKQTCAATSEAWREEAALAEPVQERNFCPRCGKRTRDIHTCTPPGDCDVHG